VLRGWGDEGKQTVDVSFFFMFRAVLEICRVVGWTR